MATSTLTVISRLPVLGMAKYTEALRRKASLDDEYSESRSPRRAETFTPSSTSAAKPTRQGLRLRDYMEMRRRERETPVEADRRPRNLEDDIALLEEKILALQRASGTRSTVLRQLEKALVDMRESDEGVRVQE